MSGAASSGGYLRGQQLTTNSFGSTASFLHHHRDDYRFIDSFYNPSGSRFLSHFAAFRPQQQLFAPTTAGNSGKRVKLVRPNKTFSSGPLPKSILRTASKEVHLRIDQEKYYREKGEIIVYSKRMFTVRILLKGEKQRVNLALVPFIARRRALKLEAGVGGRQRLRGATEKT